MEKKEKVIKILKALWLAVATVLSVVFIIACIVGGVSNKKQKESVSACIENDIIAYNINNDINKGIKPSVINPSTQAVIYDDENYKIILTADEMFNYQFNNLGSFLLDYYDEIELIYDIDTNHFSYARTADGAYEYYNSEQQRYIYFLIEYEVFNTANDTNYTDDNYFVYFGNSNVDWAISSANMYNELKSAIELDIQANQPVSINDSVFETLSSSTVGFIGTISSGITSIMAVFYAESSLTVIGKLSVIVVAVGLTYFLFRLIIGLVRMRG